MYCLWVCSDPLQKAELLILVSASGYLVVWTYRVRQGRSTPHPRWTINRTQSDGTHLSSTKKLRITGPCSKLLHSFEEKSFFIELGFGLTMQKMTTYSYRNGLQWTLLLYPSLFGMELNSFKVISCFMDKTFNTCIELGIVPLPLGLNWLWWILHWTRVIFETTNPYPLPFYSHSPF